MFDWPPGARLYVYGITNRPTAAITTGRSDGIAPPPTAPATKSVALPETTSRESADTLALELIDWRIWMKGPYDSLERQRRRTFLEWLSAIGLVGGVMLAVRAGLVEDQDRRRKRRQEDDDRAEQRRRDDEETEAKRKSAEETRAQAALVLTAGTCTRLLIEEIGRGTHADATDERRILVLTMLGTAGREEVYQALGVDPDGPWPARRRATQLIAQARRNLLSRIENLLRSLHGTRRELRRASRKVHSP